MDWYKNHFKLFAIVSSSLLVITGGSMYYGQSNTRMIGQNQILKDGVSTCFQRVTQTFTALMIGQTTSNYLSSNFINTTGDCFTDVNKVFADDLAKFIGANETVNKLVSDSHWFHEKIQKIASMNKESSDLSSSNIIEKYMQLEKSRDSLMEFLVQRSEHAKTVADTATFSAIAFFFALVFMSIGYLFVKISNVRKIDELEQAASRVGEDGQVFEIEAIISKALKLSGLINIRQMFLDNRTRVVGTRLEAAPVMDNKVEMSTLPNITTITKEEAKVSESVARTLKNIKNKAFTHGVIIDVDMDDYLNVYASAEGFDQMVYNVLDYAIDASVRHNNGRKVTLRTKALGDLCYIKFSISGHCFNSDELEYFSGGSSKQPPMELNLTLMNELARDLDGQIQVRNKTGESGSLMGAEIEFILNGYTTSSELDSEQDWENVPFHRDDEVRASTFGDPTADTDSDLDPESSRLVSIVRGKKRDLIRKLNSEV